MIIEPPVARPALTALCAASEALSGVAAAPLWSLRDDEALALLDEVHALVAQAQALGARVLFEVDQRQLARKAGAPSTKAWLRRRHQLTPGQAKRQVELARALDGPAQVTATALSAGALTAEQAHAITDVLAGAPRSAGPVHKQQAEALLVENADRCDPVELRQLGIHIWSVLDPDSADAEEGRRLEAQEARAYARRRLAMPGDGDGGVFLTGHLDAEGGGAVRTALDPLAAPLPASAAGPDPRTAPQRYADALVELCRRALADGKLPDNGGEPPQLVLTVQADALPQGCGSARGQVGPQLAHLDDGGLVSTTNARRIGCDAMLTMVVLDEAGVPLSMGRRRRLFPRALRRALVLRDAGCAFPGCDRSPRWCDAHHITHWADGGETSLDNGVLLCGYHHRLIHGGEWRITVGVDGHPDFHPPPWIGADRIPLRNHAHRHLGQRDTATSSPPAPGLGSFP